MRTFIGVSVIGAAVAFGVQKESINEPKEPEVPEPLGANKCTWGPSYWCDSAENQAECGVDDATCAQYTTAAPVAAETQEPEPEPEVVGADPCTWGPSYWCASAENMAQCDSSDFCMSQTTQAPSSQNQEPSWDSPAARAALLAAGFDVNGNPKPASASTSSSWGLSGTRTVSQGSRFATRGSWSATPGSWSATPGSWSATPGSWSATPGSWSATPVGDFSSPEAAAALAAAGFGR